MSAQVHYVVDAAPGLAEGAPVVLMSGSLGSTLSMWDPQIRELSTRFRVVRYDTRGHGGSPLPETPWDIDDLVDDAIALLDRLGVGRAHVVGLSLGGMTMMRLAARCPGRVATLTVMSTSPLLGPARGWADRAQVVRDSGTAAVAIPVVERWFTPGFRASNPGVVAAMVDMVSSTSAEGYAACCGVIERMDLRADLARITAPTLAIAGADDPATPPEHLERIAAGVADSRLLVVPNAAHLASFEQPAEVTAALLSHLDSMKKEVG